MNRFELKQNNGLQLTARTGPIEIGDPLSSLGRWLISAQLSNIVLRGLSQLFLHFTDATTYHLDWY